MGKAGFSRKFQGIFLLLAVLFAAPCAGRTIIVDANGTGDYPTIQAAIDDSNDGDVVVLCPGTFTGPGNRDIDFKGKAITVRSTDPNDPNIVAATIIDCNGSSINRHRGFYFHSGESLNSILDGFTIINGYYKTSNLVESRGAAIYCYDHSSPTVRNCIIRNNVAWEGGGICCSYYSSPQIERCVITENEAYNLGAGLFCQRNCDPVISNCTISWNPPKPDVCQEGGGIYCTDNCAPVIKHTLIEHNQSEYYGGGAHLGPCGTPGPTFQNCTIRFNSSCYGGGVESYKGEFVNCLFSFNGAWQGGAAHCGNTEFCNCTFAGNSASYEGPTILGSGIITNCILWGSYLGGVSGHPIEGAPAVSFSNVQGGWPGEGNIDIDPGFAFFDRYSPYSDFHLPRNSPCIDAGTNTPSGGLPPTDLDGALRQLDGNGDTLAVADMGAYEHNPTVARIAASPEAIRLSGPAGGPNPPGQTFRLRNTGGGTLSWQIDYRTPWLQLGQTRGTSDGETVDIRLGADTTTLSPGQYEETLLISAPQADNSPFRVAILLTVGRCRHVPSEYPSIQAAIDASSEEGDAVILVPQTYRGNGNRDIRIEDKSIIVAGSDPSDPCVVAATVIDCEGTETANHFGFSITVDIPYRTMQSEQVVLHGLTITRGHVDRGSAIGCAGLGSVILSRCLLRGNSGTAISSLARDVLISECAIRDNTSTSRPGGILCSDGTRITRCNISRNHGGGVYCLGSDDTARSVPQIDNSIISGNSADSYGAAILIYQSHASLANLTIVGNRAGTFGGGIACRRGSSPSFRNCILYENAAASGHQIALLDQGFAGRPAPQATFSFSTVPTGPGDLYTDPNTYLYLGLGNIDADPCFADAGYWDPNGTPDDANDDFWVDGEYHLKSQAGRWDGNDGRWTIDEVTSPCIDAGDPMSPIGLEPFPNGGIINMGTYGGTAEASKSYFGGPVCETIVAGDVNGDCLIDFKDFFFVALHWLEGHN